MMDLKQIHYFIVVCEQRSFSRAVDILDISQPSLSRQIQLLETELKQHLLRRTGRGVEPTEAGLRFLNHAKAIHKLATHAKQDLRSFRFSPQGRVRLGMPPRIARRLTPHLVQKFRTLFPDASITIAEGLSTEMREWLIKDRVDLALLYEPPPSALMACESIYREDLVLAYTRTCHPVPPATIKVTDLGQYPLVLPSAPNTIRALVDNTCRDLNVQLNIVAEVDVVQTIVETTSYGNMFTVIPRSAIGDIPGQAELSFSAITKPAIKNNLTLALPVNGPNSKLISETADIIRSLDFAHYLS
ncbi:MAG TPA: LysR family transcriptional regulator [Eoetvoesiella sp.]